MEDAIVADRAPFDIAGDVINLQTARTLGIEFPPGFLRWSITELAAKANVGISTVQRIEAADAPAVRDDLDWRASARGESIQAIRETLIGAGITLLPDDAKGVGVRGKARTGRQQ